MAGATIGLLAAGDRRDDQRRTSLKERRIQRHAQLPIDQHPQRRTLQRQCRGFRIQPQLIATHGQPRGVHEHGIGAGQHHAGAGAQALHLGTCGRAGDPLAFAAGHRGAPVQAHREFGANERQAAFHTLDKAAVDLARLGFQHAAGDFDAGAAQQLQTATGDLRIGVLHGRHHASNASPDQRFGTGRRTPVMAAGFEGDVRGGTAGALTRLAQRMHFGMRLAGT